jgi:hypothetical protein
MRLSQYLSRYIDPLMRYCECIESVGREASMKGEAEAEVW